MLKAAVRDCLAAAGLFHEKARLLCAVSGGADSVALLAALCALRPEGGYALTALHVQHGLRGESSLADEAFVRALCADMHVPLVVENANLTGGMADPGAETRARDSRRRIFARQMDALSADALLLAHHRDDQTETVLMHLLRGAGMAGLCGMRPCVPFGRGVALRPFLALPKARLLQALRESGLAHREDESNLCQLTPRNALRLTLLPQLEKLFPGAGAHIATLAETLAADEEALTAQTDEIYARALYDCAPLFSLNRALLLAQPQAIQRRVLRRWVLAAMGHDLPDERALCHEDTLALVALLREGKPCNLPRGLCACAGAEWLHLRRQSGRPLRPVPPVEPQPVCPGAREYRLRDAVIAQQPVQPGCALPADACSVILSPALLAETPVWRLPQPGDRVQPFGAPGAKPLRRYLTDRKVDPVLRPLLPVLALGSDILWIPSLCTAQRLRASQVVGGSVRLILSGGAPFLPHQPKE